MQAAIKSTRFMMKFRMTPNIGETSVMKGDKHKKKLLRFTESLIKKGANRQKNTNVYEQSKTTNYKHDNNYTDKEIENL